MGKNRKKLIVILGPTATGKSDLAVSLAKSFKGEIISADSRQVYKGMDIATGKITKNEMRKIPHYLLDVASPFSKSYNAAKFQKDAEKKITEIFTKDKVPFVVGGTGFWIDILIKKINLPEVKPNPILRKKLDSKSTSELVIILNKLNPSKVNSIDIKNKVRLIRAIEIEKGLKKHKNSTKKIPIFSPSYGTIFIGLDLPTENLHQNIDLRLKKRFKQGMVEEVLNLHKKGLSWKKMEEFGLEYKFIAQYLQKKISYEEMETLLSFAIKHYAKRQRTWFKRNKNINWLNANKKTAPSEAAVLIKKFLES